MIFTNPLIYISRYGILISVAILLISCASMGSMDRQTKLLSDQFYELLSAEMAIQLQDKEQSLDHYYKAALLTENEEVYRSAIALAVNLGDYRKAKILAEHWYRSDAENTELNQVMVLIYLQSEDYAKALQHIEILLATEDGFDNRQMLPLLGTIEIEQSREILDKLEQAAPQHAAAYWLRAYLNFYYGLYEEALSGIEQALVYDPALSKAIALKADILFALGKTAEALEWLSEQATKYPQDFLLQAQAAMNLENRGHILPAQKFYAAAYNLKSDKISFILQYAIFNINEDRFDSAEQLLTRYSQLGGDAEVANYYRALLAEKRGDMQTAIDYYRAVKSTHLHSEAKLGIAKIYQTQGLFEKSDEQFQALRELGESEDEQIRYYIAQTSALRAGGFKTRAMQLYDEALGYYPDSLSLLYSRGMLALEMEQLDLFEQDMKRVIELDKNNWQALNALGYTLADLNRQLDDAGTYIRRAYRLNPTEPAIIDSMGWLEFRLNNLTLAESYIRKAASVFHDAEILGHWVEILLSMQKHTEAAQLLDEALADFPENEYLLRLHQQISP